jgi:phospholipid/cholesterol/gamma-HCH transport system substrate-binding protein
METRARYIVVGLFTLFVAFVGIGFIFWLHGGASFTKRSELRVKFQGPTAGVQTGSIVSFNGLKVGEVTDLRFDQTNPHAVDAILSIDSGTPLSSETKVSIESDGLMGASYVSLTGNESGKPLVAAKGQSYVELSAPAGSSLAQDARSALSSINNLVGQNSEPLHDAIENINTFSAALARNSNRIDGILVGVERMTGGGAATSAPIRTFDLDAPKLAADFEPTIKDQLVVADPSSLVSLDTQRLLSRTSDGQIVIQSSQWSDTIPKLVQKKVLETLERAEYSFASPPTDGLTPDYQLLLDIQSFQVNETSPRKAVVQFNARLQSRDGKIIGSHFVEGFDPAESEDGPEAAKAMDGAFAAAMTNLLPWYQRTIEANRRVR